MVAAKLFLLLILCSRVFGSGSDGDFFIRAEVQQSAVPPPPPEILAYDDGNAFWFSWAGTYRAVWFDLYDFVVPTNYQVHGAEMWFYHHSEYPWDTGSFLCEVWLGDLMGPIEKIASEACIAQQYSSVYCQFDWQPYYPEQFWILLDMSESVGGWPSVVCDNTGYANEGHSYFSNDFIVWEPWIIQESSCFPLSYESCSWGNLKTLF